MIGAAAAVFCVIVAIVIAFVIVPRFQTKVYLYDSKNTTDMSTTVSGWTGGTVVLPEPAVQHDGYVFGGWTHEGGSSAAEVLEAGTEVKVDDYRSYFSVWYPTVTFDGGGAESGSMDSVEVRNNDGMYTLPECGFTKSGYVFSGWKDSNGQGVLFPGYETYVSQPVTYVAVWQPPITVGEVSVKSPSVINGTIEGWSPDMDGIALKIKNETDKVLTLTTELAVLGESGGKQEASSDYISAVGPGETVLVSATVLDENKKGKQTAYTIEATDEFSSLFTPISGMIKQEIIDQKNDELTLKISNTSNRDIYISGVGLIAKDKSGTTLIGNGYYYVELKPGESGDVTFRDTNLLGGGQIHADWSSLTCEFYIEGYSNNF